MSLRADRKHVAHYQKPDHQNRINRGTTSMRVIGRKLPVYPAQVEHGVDLSNQMIWRNHLIQIKRIKELPLPDSPPTHHEPPPRIIAHRRNHGSLIVSTRVLQQNRGAKRTLIRSP